MAQEVNNVVPSWRPAKYAPKFVEQYTLFPDTLFVMITMYCPVLDTADATGTFVSEFNGVWKVGVVDVPVENPWRKLDVIFTTGADNKYIALMVDAGNGYV